MSRLLGKANLLTIFLTVLVVFVMATGAFVGAANQSIIDDNLKSESLEIEPLHEAGYTWESDLVPVEPNEVIEQVDELGAEEIEDKPINEGVAFNIMTYLSSPKKIMFYISNTLPFPLLTEQQRV